MTLIEDLHARGWLAVNQVPLWQEWSREEASDSGHASFLEELLALFIREGQQDLDKLNIDPNDRRPLHRWRGRCLQLGLTGIAGVETPSDMQAILQILSQQ